MFNKKKIKKLEEDLKNANEEIISLKNKIIEQKKEMSARLKHDVKPTAISAEETIFKGLSNDVLFDAVVGSLPLVFNYDKPIEIYSFEVWCNSIKRNNIISSCCSIELKDFFEELSLKDIKRKFYNQLWRAYKEKVNFYLSEHNKVLLKHYHPNSNDECEDGGKK